MRRPFTALALSGAFILCSCTPKEGSKVDSSAVAQTGAASAAAGFDPTTRVATIVAQDYAFVAPDSITAGWTTVRLKNDGVMPHHAVLVRLDSGRTLADLTAALKEPKGVPAWAAMVGGPNAPNPGAETSTTLHLTPGQYALLCFVDMPEHLPHIARGMVHSFVVTAGSGPEGTEPTADATMTFSDYSFAIQGTLKAGKHVIKVLNAGPQIHEVEVVRLAPGKTVKDLSDWAEKMAGPPPATLLGGVAPEGSGAKPNYFDLDLTPGDYVLLCFVQDAKDGKPHLAHGMVKEFRVE